VDSAAQRMRACSRETRDALRRQLAKVWPELP
jgi:hypothetical protein